jgi:hypothetical protein
VIDRGVVVPRRARSAIARRGGEGGRRGRRRLAAALALAASLACGAALAHATLVFGEATVTPDPPVAGAPFELALTLEDPSLTPVEDAIVLVEVRPFGQGAAVDRTAANGEPTPPLAAEQLTEGDDVVYRTRLVLPAEGSYQVLVRDQTFAWEEATATVVLDLSGEAVGRLPFILPPTQVGPRSLWTWLLWLIGLPLIAGAVVTVLVLTSAKKPADAEPETP